MIDDLRLVIETEIALLFLSSIVNRKCYWAGGLLVAGNSQRAQQRFWRGRNGMRNAKVASDCAMITHSRHTKLMYAIAAVPAAFLPFSYVVGVISVVFWIIIPEHMGGSGASDSKPPEVVRLIILY
jgi:hypothetical protein